MTTKTIDITPHWPGMCRWLRATFIDIVGHEPDIVGFLGGKDTAMLAIDEEQVYEFHGNVWGPRNVDPGWVRDHFYCSLAKDGTYTEQP